MYHRTSRLLLVFLVMIACTVDDRTEDRRISPHRPLKGPAAKNTPTQQRTTTPVVTRSTPRDKKRWGGAVKNTRPWLEREASRYQSLVRQRKQKQQGPRAKNRRPWGGGSGRR